MTTLVTGSGTLVGKSISLYLSSKSKIISTYRSSFPKNLSKIKNIKVCRLDLNKKINLSFTFNTLIHCASAIPDYQLSKKKLLKTNVQGFRKILSLCRKNKVKYIVLLSSVSVYGKIKSNRINEKTPTYLLDDTYGNSKLQMEMDLINYAKKEKINFLILRLPAILGKNSSHNFLSKLVKSIKEGGRKEFLLKNSNFKLNNFIHIKTLSEVVYYGIKKKLNGLFILGSKNPIKLKNIINKIKDYKKISVTYQNDRYPFNIDINKALRWKIPLRKTSCEITEFLKENFRSK